MSQIDKGALAMMLGVRRGEIDDLVLAGTIEGPAVQSDGSLRFDTEAPLTAALLAMTPAERREAGVKDTRGVMQRKMRLNMSNEREAK